MPKKNLKGGKGHKKKKAGSNIEVDRELILKDIDGQEYAQIEKLYGSCRMEINCFDGRKRLLHVRGKLRKKEWVAVGDVILISLREFEDDKADLLMKYRPKEIRRLKQMGEIPENVKINEADAAADNDGDEMDIGIDFIEEEEGTLASVVQITGDVNNTFSEVKINKNKADKTKEQDLLRKKPKVYKEDKEAVGNESKEGQFETFFKDL